MDIPERNARDLTWVRLIAAGGAAAEKAVVSLFREYRRPLLAFLIRHGVPPDQAEDVLQEAFIRVVRGASGFRAEAAVSSWLYQIARNLAVDLARTPKREEQLDDEGWSYVADRVACTNEAEAAQAIDDCVNQGFAAFARQHPERAEALRRAALDGWSVREVAQFLSRTEAATREYLSQVRKRLREYLLPCLELVTAQD